MHLLSKVLTYVPNTDQNTDSRRDRNPPQSLSYISLCRLQRNKNTILLPFWGDENCVLRRISQHRWFFLQPETLVFFGKMQSADFAFFWWGGCLNLWRPLWSRWLDRWANSGNSSRSCQKERAGVCCNIFVVTIAAGRKSRPCDALCKDCKLIFLTSMSTA